MSRMTRQRTAVIDALKGAGRPLSPGEILSHGGAGGGVGDVSLSTVYRTINWLVDQGMIAPVDIPGQAPRYEMAAVAHEHHHHFHCSACDRVFDIPGCGGVAQMAPSGFEVTGHSLTLTGRCAECVEGVTG